MHDRLRGYHSRIAEHQLAPLWERIRDLLPPEPRVTSVPHRWDYAGLRDVLLESAELIAEDEAERRVLILENPALPGESGIIETLFAGFQLIMPGEIAPAHRHTMGALRFILEGDGAYTSVDGEPLTMSRGDLILTPNWAWHDHTHEGTEPVVWLDVLDLPAVRSLGPRFAAHHPDGRPARSAPPGYSHDRYGYNMRPAVADKAQWRSPLKYPYEQARATLAHMQANSAVDACHGIKMEYVNPTDGSAALPTISAFLQLFPGGFEGARYQSTDGGIYCVVEGRGTVAIGDGENRKTFQYKPNDVFAVPCWAPYAFSAQQQSIIFSATDRSVQSKLGLWRERRAAP